MENDLRYAVPSVSLCLVSALGWDQSDSKPGASSINGHIKPWLAGMSSDKEVYLEADEGSATSSKFDQSSSDEDVEIPSKRSKPADETSPAPTKRPKLPSVDISSQSEAESVTATGTKLGSRPSLSDLHTRRAAISDRLRYLQQSFGRKCHPLAEPSKPDTAWDYLLHEMMWMAEDFDRERRLKAGKAKKIIRSVGAYIRNKQEAANRAAKDMEKQAVIKCGRVARMVSNYWRNVEKLALHLRQVELEEKEQAQRSKRLDKFVERQLKLTSQVAADLTREQRPVVIELVRQGEEWRVWDESQEAGLEAAMAEEMQPKGYTLTPSRVYCKVPFLLIGKLREYQHIGLDWLVTLHDKNLNGILADEMGLGKTIQTIALLSYLACERNIWGPHLIVVPTSIMINWEMELKRWCPGFKVLTYFGTQKERKAKRVGWSKANSFHVCVTSYKLIVQDQFAFRRKPWYYLILDEAQHIKNFQSLRWQVLSRFSARRRLLLTGTPLQNDVIELWALLHFLMPHLFQSHDDFAAWFSNPFNQAFERSIEFNQGIIQRLQSIIRPFILRRLKKDVETQLPGKYEHVVFCTLSKRQQYLYDEFLAMRGNQESSEYMGVMNLLMQLRKVCNHPELFAPRFVISPLRISRLDFHTNWRVLLSNRAQDEVSMRFFGVLDAEKWSKTAYNRHIELLPKKDLIKAVEEMRGSYDLWSNMKPVVSYRKTGPGFDSSVLNPPNVTENCPYLPRSFVSVATLPDLDFVINSECGKNEVSVPKASCNSAVPVLCPIYGRNLTKILTLSEPQGQEIALTPFVSRKSSNSHDNFSDGYFPISRSDTLHRLGLIQTLDMRLDSFKSILNKFQACPPKVLSATPGFYLSKTKANDVVSVILGKI